MPVYRYQSLPPGAAATIEAPDRVSAVRELVRNGLTPVSVEEISSDTAQPGGAAAGSLAQLGASLARRHAMSRSEMASFIRELATAVQAGLPLVPALRTIAKQGRSAGQRAMLESVIDQVEAGKHLADAAAAWGRPFSDLTVNLIRAGEASGRLAEVLVQAAELLDRDVKLRRQILAATLYPMILAGLISISVAVVVTVIVPRIIAPLKGQVLVLPWPTRVLQALANAIGGYWWILVPVVLVGFFAVGRLCASPGPRLKIDRGLLSVPVLGRLLRDVAVARFTRTLGTLTAAGIPALTALRITKGTLNN